MKKCPQCGKCYDDTWGKCLSDDTKLVAAAPEDKEKLKNIIVTTTDEIAGKQIKSYQGVVNGIIITGFGAFREFMSAFTDAFGGKSGSYQKEYKKAKDLALEQLKEEAMGQSANAVVCVRMDFENISAKNKSLVMVSATGTAVVVE